MCLYWDVIAQLGGGEGGVVEKMAKILGRHMFMVCRCLYTKFVISLIFSNCSLMAEVFLRQANWALESS